MSIWVGDGERRKAEETEFQFVSEILRLFCIS